MNLVAMGKPALALRPRLTTSGDAMKPWQRRAARLLMLFGLAALTSLLSAEPAFAQSSLESLGQNVLNLFSNGLLRTFAIIGLIVVGLSWLNGRVNTGALVTVILGIAIMFSAPWIVDQLGA